MKPDKFNCFALLLIFLLILSLLNSAYADPIIVEPNFKVEEFLKGLNFPVQIGFVGNDIMILQKNDGQVRLVRDGVLQNEPVLKIDVYNKGHLGLLGITSVKDNVFLYVSQNATNSSQPAVNRIYKYFWNGEKLIDPVLVNELPAGSGFDHSGGVLVTGLDSSVYGVIGDTFTANGTLQNNGGNEPDDTSIILRVGKDPSIIKPHLSDNPTDSYYGLGIRNSFGLAIDPFTGYLWETENGPENFDEINLVMPHFNSGWNRLMGPISRSQLEQVPQFNGFTYSDPEFSWGKAVAPTGLTFVGQNWNGKYNDTLFAGDFDTGTIYKFKLNSDRTGFNFQAPELSDLVADPGDPLKEIIFGIGFTAISDIEMGPDGKMYVLSFKDGGTLYRISSVDNNNEVQSPSKQLFNGILPAQISCNDGYVILMGIQKNKVACVEPNSAIILIQRHWGNPVEHPLNKCYTSPNPNVDWSGCNFSFKNLSNINLENANLVGTSIVGSNLSKSNLSKSNLSMANLVFSNFSDSDLASSNLQQSSLLYSDFHNSNLTNTTFISSNLSYADFTNADLSNSVLNYAYFTNANLANADISGASLIGTILHFADLEGANLSNANLEKANFYEANLNNANFSNCQNHDLCK